MVSVAVVGSRGFSSYDQLRNVLDGVANITRVVSGGADGADTLAARFARERGIELQVFLPDWAQYGKAAGPIRNRLIVEASDVVVAFWDGTSRGTASTIAIAKELGKPCSVVDYYTLVIDGVERMVTSVDYNPKIHKPFTVTIER